MKDVIIIGGGLGGLSLSIQLQRKGMSCVLLEQKTYPFHRVCGEYISYEAWPFLTSLGVDPDQYQLPKINKLRVSSNNGDVLEKTMPQGGRGISRYFLDNLLYEIALNDGVDVRTSCKVNAVYQEITGWEVHTTSGNIKGRTVVGAFGKRSSLDKFFERNYLKKNLSNSRLKNFVGVKYHLEGDFPDDVIELHNFSGGYCGISKVENDKICMCYLSRGQNLKKVRTLKEMESAYLSKNPFLRKYLEFDRAWDKPVSIAKIDFSSKNLIESNIPMIGDAAGLIAPLCGNGMSMSLQSSVMLADLLLDYLNDNLSWDELVEHYKSEWKQTFGKRLFIGRSIQKVFGEEYSTSIMINLLKRMPKVTDKLISSTHGEIF
ncbi:FAD-binding protein [Flammeovirga sp. MY04]|uniref:NAD(P)/FAD-dependent oxidoreductase n=1 Tax=Flammeovirga sp. MY04 TaxID=1191459 RepID=UPI0008060CD8|nr:FAD-dependent monooxygenase [Flammeovirga sp. MY04]ANQ52314.1 FAD-binding protein [Flammeovirga sp. MY04]